MKYKGYALLIAVGLLLSSVSVYCQETYDPNAGPAATEQPVTGDALSTDARLSANISYTGKKVPVRTVLENIMETSKVTLRAGINSTDWKVRDRKLNVFAKDAPLREVMNSISRVTGFKWSIEGTKAVPVYRLVWDTKSQREVDALRESVRIAEEQALAQKRQEGYETLTSLDKLSQDDLAKLRAENPFLFYMAASGMAKNMNNFIGNSSDISNALKSGSTLTLKASDLSPAARRGLEDVVGQMKSIESKFRGRQPNNNDDNSGLGDATITINAPMPGGGRGMGRGMRMMGGDMLGSIMVRSEKGFTMIPMVNPNNPMTKAFGKMMIEADLLNRPFRDVMSESMAAMGAAMQQNMSNIPTGGAANRTVTNVDGQVIVTEIPDKVLDATVKVDMNAQNLPDIQERITTATGVTIVSDNYGSAFGFGFGRGGGPAGMGATGTQETTLRKLLDEVARRYQYQWNKPSSPVEFQDADWFDKIDLLIPDALIDGWKNTLKKTGTLGIADLAEMAKLSQEQFGANIMPDEILGRLNLQMSVMQNREILNLFGVLSKSQISAAFSRNGLNLKALKGDAAGYVNQTFGKNTAMFENPDAPLVLTASQSKEGNNIFIDVTMSTREQNKQPLTWRIPQPSYTAPAK